GVRKYLARHRHRAWAPRRPAWLREEFWRRAALAQRWVSATVPRGWTRSREPGATGIANAAWGILFDYFDAGCLGHAIEGRHPLPAVRVHLFAVGLRAVPGCVDKHLPRRCPEGMPEAIRARPKTPAFANPVVELVRRRGRGAVRRPWQSAALAPFLDVAAV